METHIYTIQIRVLLYPEENEWVARALELDLLGYGKTQTAAIGELKAAVGAQLSFAHQMRDDSLLPFPAEQEYFRRWEEAQSKALRSGIVGDKSVKLEARAAVISLTASELKVIRKRRFKQTASACA